MTRAIFTGRRVVLGLLVFGLLALFSPFASYAQENSVGLSISPTSFELNADPGDVLVNQIKVHNPTDAPLTVTMKERDFYPVGEEGQVALSEPEESSSYSVASWTTFTPDEFVLQPGEQQVITFSIVLPEDAEPGGHWGSIAATLSGSTSDETGSSVGNERSTLILLKVSGDLEEEVIVDTFTTEEFREYGPVDFDVKFENVGNVHVKPVGFVTVTDYSGDEVVQIELPQNNVIPGAKRIANVSWDEEKMIGRYTATLVANYGTGQQEVVTDSITFTVFPWKVALAIFAVVVVVVVILVMMRKRLAMAAKALAGK